MYSKTLTEVMLSYAGLPYCFSKMFLKILSYRTESTQSVKKWVRIFIVYEKQRNFNERRSYIELIVYVNQ